MRILYVVSTADFFCSHRLDLALEAKKNGHVIALLTGMPSSNEREREAKGKLESEGIPHFLARFESGGLSFFSEGRGFLEVLILMKRWKPDLVHCVSPKGILYGGLAARIGGIHSLVLAISGMGWLFSGQKTHLLSLMRSVFLRLLKIAATHPNCRIIVQNSDDRSLVINNHLAKASNIHLIPGSGVKIDLFKDIPLGLKKPIVILPARLLADKGVKEFVMAAQMIRSKGIDWRFALVGGADYDNPSVISRDIIEAWVRDGFVEWWGFRSDMVEVYKDASIVCLPSYREGMPKSLLEAAAAGCAVVTTNVPGCREAIEIGQTGDLVQARNIEDLSRVLEALILDPGRRLAYGIAGRAMAINKFDLTSVIERTLKIYQELPERNEFKS